MNTTSILDRINENVKLLSDGQISEIDRDILLADLRELYTLVKGQTTAPKIIVPPVAEVKEEAPVVEKVEAPVVNQIMQSEPILIPVLEEKHVVEQAPVRTEVIIEEPVPVVSKRIHYHEGVPVREPHRSSLNEVFVGEEKSINTVLGADKRKDLNDHISRKDFKSLIDLNKQHVLIAELFNGDAAAFHSAISHINNSPTIEAAFEYIKTDLLPKYKWKGEQQSTKLFDKLVRQKFGV